VSTATAIFPLLFFIGSFGIIAAGNKKKSEGMRSASAYFS
jgi:hypothetical protein